MDGFEAAAEAGIHRIAVPTPFAVGRVKRDEVLALIRG
jgi:hypothetical protein